jgi:undecaprenyl-diphosphatase
MDWSVAHAINTYMFHHDAIEDPLLGYVEASEALFLGMLVVVIAFFRHARWAAVRRTAVAAGLSAALGLLVGKIITSFSYRPRPFVAHPRAVHLFASHAHDSSFPSDHATASIAIATAILLRGKSIWGWITLFFALVLMLGRVALGFHYPSDVLGGAAIGAAAALVLYAPPLRRWVDAASDLFGRVYDRALDRLLALAGGRLARSRAAR